MSSNSPRISPIDVATAQPDVGATLDAVKAEIGMVPNLFKTLAQSPAALDGYLGLSATLGKGSLTAAQREIVALAVGQVNRCAYCLSAHTLIGKGAGLSEAAIEAARRGTGSVPADAALAAFAHLVASHRGVVEDEELAAFKQAGFDDGAVLEVIAHVALNTLTNYANHVAKTDIDFPAVTL